MSQQFCSNHKPCPLPKDYLRRVRARARVSSRRWWPGDEGTQEVQKSLGTLNNNGFPVAENAPATTGWIGLQSGTSSDNPEKRDDTCSQIKASTDFQKRCLSKKQRHGLPGSAVLVIDDFTIVIGAPYPNFWSLTKSQKKDFLLNQPWASSSTLLPTPLLCPAPRHSWPPRDIAWRFASREGSWPPRHTKGAPTEDCHGHFAFRRG